MMLKSTPRATILSVGANLAIVNMATNTNAANPSASHQIGRHSRSSSAARRHVLVPMPNAILEMPIVEVSAPMTSPRRAGLTYSVASTGAVIQIPAPAPPTRATPMVSESSPCAVDVMMSPTTLVTTATRMMVIGSRRGERKTTPRTPATYRTKMPELG